MKKMTITDAKDYFMQSHKNVLVIDTCCVLDIIRCIQRNNLAVVESIVSFFEEVETSSESYDICFPSLIYKEWMDNSNDVKNETKKHITSFCSSNKKIIKVVDTFYHKKLENFNFLQYNLDERLYDISNQLLEKGIHFIKNEECISSAFERVASHIPPAAQGKDSIKDCVIFEELLLVSRMLRNEGFDKNIVFASANTAEFYNGSILKEQIELDLKEHNIKIVTTLNHGLHMI